MKIEREGEEPNEKRWGKLGFERQRGNELTLAGFSEREREYVDLSVIVMRCFAVFCFPIILPSGFSKLCSPVFYDFEFVFFLRKAMHLK
ncbi:hypothetical protein V6N13_078905 [Hibiscus sabdariffa]